MIYSNAAIAILHLMSNPVNDVLLILNRIVSIECQYPEGLKYKLSSGFRLLEPRLSLLFFWVCLVIYRSNQVFFEVIGSIVCVLPWTEPVKVGRQLLKLTAECQF